MSSAESTNGISRRAVLAGAAAIGGTIAVASALGTGVTTAQAAPSVTGTAGATGANSAGGVTVPAAQRTTKSVKTVTDAPALPGWKVAPFPLRNVANHLEQRVRSCKGRDARLCTQLSGRPLAGLLPRTGEPAA